MVTELLLWGLVAHVVCDWLLQNNWMAQYKTSLRHPAAWVHSGIHLLGMLCVFPLGWALTLAISHLLIDTRVPLQWWNRVIGGPESSERIALHVALWRDQATHVALLALAAKLAG